jgi:hypothetical protein
LKHQSNSEFKIGEESRLTLDNKKITALPLVDPSAEAKVDVKALTPTLAPYLKYAYLKYAE